MYNSVLEQLFAMLQKGGEKLGYETEAFAIYDTMRYVKPAVHTLCVGNAFGESAMLLAAGEQVSMHCPCTCLEGKHMLASTRWPPDSSSCTRVCHLD